MIQLFFSNRFRGAETLISGNSLQQALTPDTISHPSPTLVGQRHFVAGFCRKL